MSKEKRNIEDFLKDKLQDFDHGYQSDWSRFEEKLDRAIFFYRLKIGAVVSVLLILVSLGIFGTSAFVGTGNADRSVDNQTQQRSLAEEVPVVVTPEQKEGNFKSSESGASVEESTVNQSEGRRKAATGDKSQKATFNTPQVAGYLSDQKGANANGNAKNPGANAASIDNTLAVAEEEQSSRKAAQPKQGNLEDSRREAQNKQANEKTAVASRASHRGIDKQAGEITEDQSRVASLDQSKTELEAKDISPRLNLDTRGLDEELKNAENRELDVRPPVMPVTLKRAGPYVSPMQEKSPWSYSLSVYPNFTFRKFKVDRDKLNLIHRDFIDATQEAERGGFSLNIGLRISRRVGKITYLNGGMEYINYKTRAEFDFTNFREAEIDPLTNQIVQYNMKSDPEQVSFVDENVYHYLNFPISISHQPWATDHIRLNIEAGASYMYFLTARGKSIDYRTLEIIDISERDYRNSMGAFHVKVGATYHISPQFNFGFEPTMMYFTNTIYSEEYPFEVIPYSIGVNLKLQMKLN